MSDAQLLDVESEGLSWCYMVLISPYMVIVEKGVVSHLGE